MRKFADVTSAFRLRSALGRISAIIAIFAVASSGWAQQALYPLKEGIVQPLRNRDIPNWMTLDMELRRTDLAGVCVGQRASV
jgi:hypothetical protein